MLEPIPKDLLSRWARDHGYGEPVRIVGRYQARHEYLDDHLDAISAWHEAYLNRQIHGKTPTHIMLDSLIEEALTPAEPEVWTEVEQTPKTVHKPPRPYGRNHRTKRGPP